MAIESEGAVPIASESDIVAARRVIRRLAAVLGFGDTDTTRIVTAASELTRNIFLYAGSGVMRWRALTPASNFSSGARPDNGLELAFVDQGPGIADVEKALQAGYSSGSGLGMGLSGARRLVDEMEINSRAGIGTHITVRKWVRRS